MAEDKRLEQPLSAAEIEELRELEAKASPAPWWEEHFSDDEENAVCCQEHEFGHTVVGIVCREMSVENRALIAAMRNTLPRLLSMLQPLAQGGHRVCNESECCHVQNSAEATAQCLEYQATIARLVADLERLAQSPTDETVREAVEELSKDVEFYSRDGRHTEFIGHIDTLLSYVRAVQSPRLTGEQVEAVKEAVEVLGYCEASIKLRAAFPGEFGQEG